MNKWWAVSVVGLVAAYLGYSSYVANAMMNIPRLAVTGSPSDVGLDYEDVSFSSRVDNIKLRGWFIQAGEPCVIVVNGGHQNRNDEVTGTLELIRDLVREGFSVLLFDLRGRGESEGRGKTLTHNDRDLGGAVVYLMDQGYSTISAIGFSAGGAALAVYTNSFRGLIIDSCFADIHDLFIRQVVARGYPAWFGKFISPGVFLMARIIHGYSAVNPEDRVGDIACPIMFVHGGADEDIPPSNSQKLYDVRRNLQDSLWVVPNAGHTQSYKADPVEYVRRVTEFMKSQ